MKKLGCRNLHTYDPYLRVLFKVDEVHEFWVKVHVIDNKKQGVPVGGKFILERSEVARIDRALQIYIEQFWMNGVFPCVACPSQLATKFQTHDQNLKDARQYDLDDICHAQLVCCEHESNSYLRLLAIDRAGERELCDHRLVMKADVAWNEHTSKPVKRRRRA